MKALKSLNLFKHQTLGPFLAPIISVFILTLGNGFYTTITSLDLSFFGASKMTVGWVSSAYFIGLLIGSYYSQFVIRRVGHIRAYAFFTSMMVVAVLIQGMTQNIFVWAGMRFIAGYDLAGLFIVIESWLVSGSDSKVRGFVIGFYLCSYYIAQSLSQMLVKVHSPSVLYGFVMIAVLAAFSMLPVCAMRCEAPQTEKPELISFKLLWQKVPLGLLSALISGMILSALYTLYPVMLWHGGQSNSHIADLIFLLIIAGAIFQLPGGKLSDRIDRRWVIIGASIITGLSGLLMCYFEHNFTHFIIFSIVMGASAFMIYPLSISYTSDHITANMAIPAIAVLSMFYGGGSVLGPLIGGPVLQWFGSEGFLIFLSISGFLLAGYTLWRVLKRPK